MNESKINESLPMKYLERIGISKKMAESLPLNFRKALVEGDMTPLIEAKIPMKNGETLYMPMKLQLVKDAGGNTMMIVFPISKKLNLENNNLNSLSPESKSRLLQGEVVVAELEIKGQKVRSYVQIDHETNSVVHRPVSEVDLSCLSAFEKVNDIELGSEQKQRIVEGKPLELNVGSEKVTVGVDLREPQGFKKLKGDMDEWNRKQQIQYDEAHPEFVGLVMTDKNRWEYQQVVRMTIDGLSPNKHSSQKMDEPHGRKI